MWRLLRSVLVVAVAVAAAVLAVPATAFAAPTTVGYDVSYPQCDSSLPRDRAFVVVGVNGGLSTKANPCLSTQLAWAWRSSGAVAEQPRAQLYLNTANPGEVRDQVTTWPGGGSTPHGACKGDNSPACSYRYGWSGRRTASRPSSPPPRRPPGWRPTPAATPGGSTSRR
ncbi:MAG: hypothetical protein M3P89_06735 [Actinomycetota bacterium]|nr:hypothetical protein [Actinomycetota bacterium]